MGNLNKVNVGIGNFCDGYFGGLEVLQLCKARPRTIFYLYILKCAVMRNTEDQIWVQLSHLGPCWRTCISIKEKSQLLFLSRFYSINAQAQTASDLIHVARKLCSSLPVLYIIYCFEPDLGSESGTLACQFRTVIPNRENFVQVCFHA